MQYTMVRSVSGDVSLFSSKLTAPKSPSEAGLRQCGHTWRRSQFTTVEQDACLQHSNTMKARDWLVVSWQPGGLKGQTTACMRLTQQLACCDKAPREQGLQEMP
jgi:hypothetical protein